MISLKKIILPSLVLSLFLVGCQQQSNFRPQNNDGRINVNDSVQPGEVAVMESDIIVNQPLSNDQVSSPLEINGRARVFEGQVFFRLKDASETVLSQGSAVALVGAPDWGFYSGNLEFDTPTSPTGWLEVYSKSVQDGSEQNLIKLPVIFKEYEAQKVTVYFGNTKENPDQLDCTKVYPIEREIAYSPQLILAALNELFRGPSTQEQDQGFITSLPSEGIKVQRLEIKDGKVFIDFNQALQEGVAGSCRVLAIRAQIIETLKLFSDTDEVVISIDGVTEDILQP